MGGAYVIGRDRIAEDARRLDEALERGQTELARVIARSIRESLIGRPAEDTPPLLRFKAPEEGHTLADPMAYPEALVSCPLATTTMGPGRILLGTCIQRQVAKPNGRTRKSGVSRSGKILCGVHPLCYSGECAQGRANARRAPQSYRPPRYNPIRPPKEQRKQREAMRRARLETVDEPAEGERE